MSNPNRAVKTAARELRRSSGIGYQQALCILSEVDEARRGDLLTAVSEHGIRTYREAVAWYERLDPGMKTLCARCGWSQAMVCPECSKGCGCVTGCSGWRHHDYRGDDGESDWAEGGAGDCPDCGAGGEYDDDPCQCEPDRCWNCGHDSNDNGCTYHCDCPSC